MMLSIMELYENDGHLFENQLLQVEQKKNKFFCIAEEE